MSEEAEKIDAVDHFRRHKQVHPCVHEVEEGLCVLCATEMIRIVESDLKDLVSAAIEMDRFLDNPHIAMAVDREQRCATPILNIPGPLGMKWKAVLSRIKKLASPDNGG